MAHGGRRVGAGRKKGSKGIKGQKVNERLQAIEAEGITPLAYLLRILRDETQESSVRLDAAKSAAPYVHPKLASVELKNDPENAFMVGFSTFPFPIYKDVG